jgi:hypothetical protein
LFPPSSIALSIKSFPAPFSVDTKLIISQSGLTLIVADLFLFVKFLYVLYSSALCTSINAHLSCLFCKFCEIFTISLQSFTFTSFWLVPSQPLPAHSFVKDVSCNTPLFAHLSNQFHWLKPFAQSFPKLPPSFLVNPFWSILPYKLVEL